MQRPPGFRSPPILSARPIQEWISQVTSKHNQLSAIALSDAARKTMAQWNESRFLHSTLTLEGTDISLEEARAISVGSAPGTGGDARLIAGRLLESIREIETLAKDNGPSAELTPEVVLRVGGRTAGAVAFRSAPVQVKSVPPEHLAAAIESACRWFTAESFSELNPIEQASIVLLRLIEIQPFEQRNYSVAITAASLFTLRAGLPALAVAPERHRAFSAAVDEGFRMNTRPMVELVAESVLQTLTELLALAEGKTPNQNA